jgi:hypothetical protein
MKHSSSYLAKFLRAHAGNVMGRDAPWPYVNSALAISEVSEQAADLLEMKAISTPFCPMCGKQKLVRNGELIQCTACGEIADELPSIKLQRLADALALILPMAKAYAHADKVGNNLAFIQSAEEALASCKPKSN